MSIAVPVEIQKILDREKRSIIIPKSNVSVFIGNVELNKVSNEDSSTDYHELPECRFVGGSQNPSAVFAYKIINTDNLVICGRNREKLLLMITNERYYPWRTNEELRTIDMKDLRQVLSSYDFNSVFSNKEGVKLLNLISFDSLSCNNIEWVYDLYLPNIKSLSYSYESKPIPDMRVFFKYTSAWVDGKMAKVSVPRFDNLNRIVASNNTGRNKKLTLEDFLSIEEILEWGITFKLEHEGSVSLIPTNRGILTKLTLEQEMTKTLNDFPDMKQLIDKYNREIEIKIKLNKYDSANLDHSIKKFLIGPYKSRITKVNLASCGCDPVTFVFNDNLAKINQDNKVKSARSVIR